MGKTSGNIRGGNGNLSPLATEAVDYYISGNGYNLQYALRTGGGIDSEDALLRRGLEEATSKPLGKEMVLYRGVSAKAIFGEDVKYGYLKSGLVNGDTDADATTYLSQAKRGIIGKTITDRGYMSTSKSASTGESFGGEQPIVLRLTTKKRTKGIDLDSKRSIYKNNTSEREVLLARGLSYKITKLYAKNGHIYADAIIQ